MVRINGFNVQRVLLDQGSSADIIYGDAFDQLGLTDKDLKPYTGILVGFSGKQVQVRGCVDLFTIFGVGENVELLRIRYLVLQVVAAYNVIIGRNTLNRLCAMISTAHLAVKYSLICGKVGRIVVDQRGARECYNNFLSLYGKKGVNDGHRCHEIEVSEGGWKQPAAQGQNVARRREQPISESIKRSRKDQSQDRESRETGQNEQSTCTIDKRCWENWDMDASSRDVLAIEPRLTAEQKGRLDRLVEDNVDHFSWEQDEATLRKLPTFNRPVQLAGRKVKRAEQQRVGREVGLA